MWQCCKIGFFVLLPLLAFININIINMFYLLIRHFRDNYTVLLSML